MDNNKMKFFLNKLYCNIFYFLIIIQPLKSMAVEYVPLEPDIFGTGVNTTNIGSFLKEVFNFGIAIAVVLAAVMVFAGGVEYMTTDNWSKKSNGLKRIQDAAFGLGLALVSYLILYIINPSLVTFEGNTIINPK